MITGGFDGNVLGGNWLKKKKKKYTGFENVERGSKGNTFEIRSLKGHVDCISKEISRFIYNV